MLATTFDATNVTLLDAEELLCNLNWLVIKGKIWQQCERNP
jgi:hypothetical protein